MRDRRVKLWLVAASMAAFIPCGANAAGLGRLTVQSGLGQLFNAEIELVAVKRGETITARLAPPEVYSQANAQFNPALAGTRITVEKRANGEVYLKASTPRPIQEPFVELIVELSSESGRVTRQYTALLDPPGYGRAAGEIPPPRTDAPVPPVALAPVAPPERPPEAAPPPPRAAAPVAPPRETATPPSPVEAPARKAAPASPAPPVPTPGQYGPVKPGETLRGIARAVKPEGVTVEQTLVALHRHNPDAFIRKNMNLVKSGKILKVPDAAEMSGLPQPEAVREVRLQLADFNAFRDRLAERVPAAPEEGSATRGRIGSVASDAAGAEPRDSVRVSRGEPPGKAAAAPKGSAEERIRVLEEEAIARQRALSEATDRIGQLEKTIRDMQRLAELKTSGVAVPQKSAESSPAKGALDSKAPAASGTVAPPRVEQSTGLPGSPGAASESPRASPGAPVAGASPDASAVAPKDRAAAPVATPASKAAAPKAAPVPEPESSGSFLDDLLDEPLYLALGAAAVLLALLGLIAARRRAAANREEPTDDDKIPPTLSGRSPEAPVRPATKPSATAAVAREPSSAIPDARTRQAVPPAAPIPPRARTPATDNDLDFDLSPGSTAAASTDGRPAASAAEVKPTIPAELRRTDAPTAAPPSLSITGASALRDPTKQPSSSVTPTQALGAAALGARTAEPPVPRPAAAPMSTEFSLDPAPPPPPAESASSKPSNLIDFDLDSLPPAPKPLEPMGGERVSSEPPPRDFDFKLDLDGLDLTTPGETKTAAAPKDAHWYDVQQKFDLAKAYQEMGDRDGARDILREVLKEGDHDQRTQATQLLARLT